MRLRALATLTVTLGMTAVPAAAQEKLPPPSKFGTAKPSTTAPRTGTTGTGGVSGSTSKPTTSSGAGNTLRPTTGGTTGTTAPGVGGTAPRTTAPAGTTGGATTGVTGSTTKAGTTKAGTTGFGATGASTAAAGSSAATRDLASYAIGLDIAARFAGDGMQVNPEMLLQGLKDGFAGGQPRYPEDKLRAAADAFERDVQARAQQRFKEIAAKNKEDGVAFLAENKKKKTVRALTSGLQYEVIKSGTGKSPKSTDKVRAHYHGTLVDGTVFDSTQNEQPIDIDVQGAIPGWTEALQIMKVGDKWRLFVPPELAYGAEGFGPVPPNAVLIFELELIDVLSPAALNSARQTTTPSTSLKK